MRRKRHGPDEIHDEDVDLNPLIDIITMIIIFFILGGKLTEDVRTEQITVPPTKTAAKLDIPKDWQLVVINVYGQTQTPVGTPEVRIRVGTNDWKQEGIDNYKAYVSLRRMLDRVYDQAEKYADPKGTGMQLPKVTLEIRADGDTQYRVVQEIQQLVADSIDPEPPAGQDPMTPKKIANVAQARPFVSINFTSRKPEKE